MPAGSLNVALLVYDFNIPAWQYQMVQQIMATRRIHLRLVIIDANTSGQQDASATTVSVLLKRLISKTPGILLNYGLRLLRSTDRFRGSSPFNPLRRRSLHALCRPEIVHELVDKQLPVQYARQSIDVLLQVDHCAEPAEWLCRASRYGVWRVFASDLSQCCGSWTGLSEYVAGAGQLYSGIIRHKFSQQTSAQPLSQQYVFLTSGSMHPVFLHRTLEPMLWKMSAILPRLLEQLRDSKAPEVLLCEWDKRYAERVDRLDLQADFTAAGWLLLYKAFVQSLQAKGKLLYEKIAEREIGVLLYSERGQLDDLAGLQRFIPPVGTFWAAPQLFGYQQRRFVFLEEWVDAQQKGRIACAEWYGGQRFSAVVPVLEEAYHLSYPHVFEFSGSYYMVPESANNKTISLYRCLRFPDRWEFVHHLMEDVAAYDATLCEHVGRWWMFVNLRHHHDSSSDDLLYLYSADSPLSRHWQSHPANPIISEVASARPAGRILRLGNKLYRPSQNCAGSYGRGLNLNRIMRWNTETYQERTLGRYVSDGTADLYGMHTFSMLGQAIFSGGIVRQPLRKPKPWQWINNKKIALQKLHRRK